MKQANIHILRLLTALLSTMIFVGHASTQPRELVVAGAGGVVANTNQQIYLDPFSLEYDINITRVSAEARRMAQLEAMVRSGNVLWDTVELSASDYPIGVKKGLLQRIDYDIVDPLQQLPQLSRREYGVGVAAYSRILVVRSDKLPEGETISSWVDFWDVEKFPGPRSLSGRPEDNLEFALLADGAPLDKLYEILSTEAGLDRAFAKLDEIKPHITVWWRSGAQSIQLLSDGEIYFSTTFNGRVSTVREAGIPVEIVWNGGALHLSFIGIPKGAKNVEEAHLYAHERATNAKKMSEYIKVIPYPGFAAGLSSYVDPEEFVSLPTHPGNLSVQFSANEEFWANNLEQIEERWNEWLLQ
jgi:putative spermidine/putrescine transport system substrate-binding protein